MSEFVNTNNSQSRPTGEYSKVISEIAQKGVCPFCPDQLRNFHKKPIEERTYWWVTDNMYPYKPTHHHCLFIHKQHVTHFSELSVEAYQELQEIVREQSTKRSITGGTLVMRFGETRFTGSTVSHLHAHLVQSNPDDPEYDPSKGVIMRIG